MSNSSFSGPVRSKNGFKTYREGAGTGVVVEYGQTEGGMYAIGGVVGVSAGTLGFAPTVVINGKGSNPDSIINPYASSTTSLVDSFGNNLPLGSLLFYGDRVFRYGLAGGVALKAGKIVQTKVSTGADHADLAITANVAAGEYAISIETAGTNLSLNEYAGGYLWANDGTGEGQTLKIASNPAHVHGTDPSVVITCHDALVTAITSAGTQVSLIRDPWSGVVIAPATETGGAMGVPVGDMDASVYGWFQIKGPCGVLATGTVIVGHQVVRSATVGGSVAPATSDILQVVGSCMQVSATTEYSLINLNM